MRTPADFAIYSSILFAFPLALLVLVLLQRASDRYHSKVSQIGRDKCTTMLLYCVYISGFVCGLIGFSLHFASSVLWCEKLGLIPCFALLGLSKTFLYLFFLRRAKFAQGVITSKCVKVFFNPIAPAYLFIYWMIYCILSSIVFTGNYSHNATISNCSLLGAFAQQFSILAGFVELFNSIISVLIFTYPLIRTMYQVKLLGDSAQFNSKADQETKLQFIAIMKLNVILTAIASLSSVTNLFMMLVAGHYIWLFCLGDPFVNAVCVFLMIAPNRRYIKSVFACSVVSDRNGIENKCDLSIGPRGKVRATSTDTTGTTGTTGTTSTTSTSNETDTHDADRKGSLPHSTVDMVIH